MLMWRKRYDRMYLLKTNNLVATLATGNQMMINLLLFWDRMNLFLNRIHLLVGHGSTMMERGHCVPRVQDME